VGGTKIGVRGFPSSKQADALRSGSQTNIHEPGARQGKEAYQLLGDQGQDGQSGKVIKGT